MPTYPMLEYLWIVPLLPLLGRPVTGLFGAKWPNKIVNSVAIGSTGLSFLCALEAVREFSSQASCSSTRNSSLGLRRGIFRAGFDLQMDQLTVVMVLVVTGVGWPFTSTRPDTWRMRAGTTDSFSYLNLFMFFMLILGWRQITCCCSLVGRA